MEAMDLVRTLNNHFGYGEWPAIYKVDADTYGHCCQYVFNMSKDDDWFGFHKHARVAIGPNGYLLFKNVELILENK